jgi:hypothetical protein
MRAGHVMTSAKFFGSAELGDEFFQFPDEKKGRRLFALKQRGGTTELI